MLANLHIVTHNIQARLDVTASCNYATSNNIHLVHITKPYPQHNPPPPTAVSPTITERLSH